jgi:hypothetical protein
MVRGEAWRWLEGLDDKSVAERRAKLEEEKKERTLKENYEEAIPRVIKDMRSGEWNKTYETGIKRGMTSAEIKASLSEGLRDGEEVNGELGRAHSELIELRDRANELVTAIEGSSAAEEAAQILESAVGHVDAVTAEVTLAMSKFDELFDFYNSMP